MQRVILLLVFCVAIATCGSPTTIYLQVTDAYNTVIAGEHSPLKGIPNDLVKVEKLDIGFETSVNIEHSGSTTVSRPSHAFSFMAYLGSAHPKLLKSLFSGTLLQKATFFVLRQPTGASVPHQYKKYEYRNCVVSTLNAEYVAGNYEGHNVQLSCTQVLITNWISYPDTTLVSTPQSNFGWDFSSGSRIFS